MREVKKGEKGGILRFGTGLCRMLVIEFFFLSLSVGLCMFWCNVGGDVDEILIV